MSIFREFLSPHASFVVTDTETTGTSAAQHRVIEIGAVSIDRDGNRDTFSQLINPGTSIPHRITRITGITTSHVYQQPPAASALPDYLDFLGDGLFTAHNIGFDRSFLNAELLRADLPELPPEGLCTLRLARRLLPGLRSKSLGNLATFFRLPEGGRHRALRDAEITADVLERLLGIAWEEHNIRDLGELVTLQRRTYAQVQPHAAHVDRIRTEILPMVPEGPGVYFMRDTKGRILYVGKAKSLASRVRSYFTAVEAHPPRIRKLVASLRDVTWQETETELDALITESLLIKKEDPAYNRALKRFVSRPYLRIDPAESFPRVTAQVIVREDGAQYFGPLRSRTEAARMLELIERMFPIRNCGPNEMRGGRRCLRGDIGRCTMPCENGDVDAYQTVLDSLIAFLRGDSDDVYVRLQADMVAAATELDFEEAARLRDWIQLLESAVIKQGAIARPLDGPDRVIWLCEPGALHATGAVVRGGAVLWTGRLPLPAGAGNLQATYERLLEIMDMPGAAATDQTTSDTRRIVEQWTYANREAVVVVERREGELRDAYVDRVMDRILEA